MMKAVLRYSKIKTVAKVAQTEGHNLRTRPTPNADPNGDGSQLILGTDDLARAVRDAVGSCTKKPKRDAVLAVEAILSASPEYFRPDDPKAAGAYNQARLNDWTKASVQWLRERFGDNLVQVTLHLDEMTPHLHGIIIPKEQKPDGSRCLNAKALLGGPAGLRRDQTDYAGAVRHLGIARGTPKAESGAQHTRIREWYETAPKEAEKCRQTAKKEADAMLLAAETTIEAKHQELTKYEAKLRHVANEFNKYRLGVMAAHERIQREKLALATERTALQRLAEQYREIIEPMAAFAHDLKRWAGEYRRYLKPPSAADQALDVANQILNRIELAETTLNPQHPQGSESNHLRGTSPRR